jgi:aspartate/methionine/tyrosine aminotransferase
VRVAVSRDERPDRGVFSDRGERPDRDERPDRGVFSDRTAWSREPSELALHVAAALQRDRQLTDLSHGNPTRVGLADVEALGALADPAGASYEPDPRGLLAARESIVGYYARRGVSLSRDELFITASTSESYAWLFKLLCDPGDAVLVPKPSYPLFPFLARLDCVAIEAYRLMRHDAWRIDIDSLERRLASDASRDRPAVRAVVVVNPSNPCGSYVHADDAKRLVHLAAEYGVALIVDEVFGDYLHRDTPASVRTSFAGEDAALCFVMSGLSKVALLPQLKLAWIICRGPQALRDEAIARLEIIADSYLSVATPVQLSLGRILARVDAKQASLLQRIGQNLAAIDAAIVQVGPSCPVRRVACDGGWYAMLEVPRTRSDDEWLARLIEEEAIVVHPGHFFDVEESGVMVVSLIVEPAVFSNAILRATRLWSQG